MRLWFCVRAIPACAFCGSPCCLTVSRRSLLGPISTWGLGPGAWLGPRCHEQKWNRRRIRTGRIAVSSGDRSHGGLGSSALGWSGMSRTHSCGHPRASPLSPRSRNQATALEKSEACLPFHWQLARAREPCGGSSSFLI